MPGASNGPCSMPVTPCVANAGRLVFHQRSRAVNKSTSGCPVMPRLSPSARSRAYASGIPVHASDEERAVMPRGGLGPAARPVYFLTLLKPLAGTTGLWPLPPGRPVSATVGELSTKVDGFTAHAP